MQGLTPKRLHQKRERVGALIETFAYSELMKLADKTDCLNNFYHYRDRYGKEVDIVIEDSEGRIVGIEVKASATVSNGDFDGLRCLANSHDQFAVGIVLYDNERIVPFGTDLFAIPISAL